METVSLHFGDTSCSFFMLPAAICVLISQDKITEDYDTMDCTDPGGGSEISYRQCSDQCHRQRHDIKHQAAVGIPSITRGPPGGIQGYKCSFIYKISRQMV